MRKLPGFVIKGDTMSPVTPVFVLRKFVEINDSWVFNFVFYFGEICCTLQETDFELVLRPRTLRCLVCENHLCYLLHNKKEPANFL
jgi:hypothetical protein